MHFKDFTLKKVDIPYYEVGEIPFLLTIAILLLALMVYLFFFPVFIDAGKTAPSLTRLIWGSITFTFLVMLIFWVIYTQLRRWWWWLIKKRLVDDDYILVEEYAFFSRDELSQKILQSFPSVVINPDQTGLALVLYKDKYFLFQKIWGIK